MHYRPALQGRKKEPTPPHTFPPLYNLAARIHYQYQALFCYNIAMLTDNTVIKPTTDLFIAALWSAPKNEPSLRLLLSGVMMDAGLPPVVKATVLNPFNIQEYPAVKQIRLDVRIYCGTAIIYLFSPRVSFVSLC